MLMIYIYVAKKYIYIYPRLGDTTGKGLNRLGGKIIGTLPFASPVSLRVPRSIKGSMEVHRYGRWVRLLKSWIEVLLIFSRVQSETTNARIILLQGNHMS